MQQSTAFKQSGLATGIASYMLHKPSRYEALTITAQASYSPNSLQSTALASCILHKLARYKP